MGAISGSYWWGYWWGHWWGHGWELLVGAIGGAGHGLRQAIGGGDVIAMDAIAMSGRLEWGLIFSGVGGAHLSALLGYARGEHG